MNVPRETRPFSPRRAAAVEAVTEIEIAAHAAPRRAPTPPPYVPMGYGPEKAIAAILALIVLGGIIFAAIEYHHWNNLPAEIGHTVEGMTQ